MLLKLSKDDNKYFDQLKTKFNLTLQAEFENNPFYALFVFFKDSSIIAYLSYQDLYDRYEIINFEVIEEERNKGIGSQLLTALIEEAKFKQKKNITLEVKIDNPAISLYESFGFIKRAKRLAYYNGIDGLLMEKELIE